MSKTKTIRAVAPILRKGKNGEAILDVVTMKFVDIRYSTCMSTIEFFVQHRVESIGWECGRIVFCGKFENDRSAMQFGQADIDSFAPSQWSSR